MFRTWPTFTRIILEIEKLCGKVFNTEKCLILFSIKILEYVLDGHDDGTFGGNWGVVEGKLNTVNSR